MEEVPHSPLSAQTLQALWHEQAQDEAIPRWSELNEYGEIVLLPSPSLWHQRWCSQLAIQVLSQLGGEAVLHVGVLTCTAGIRLADVVWMPSDRWVEVLRTDYGEISAPELIIEVLMPEDNVDAVAHRVEAYLASGTQEVIVVDEHGVMKYHHSDGTTLTSIFGLQLSGPVSSPSLPAQAERDV